MTDVPTRTSEPASEPSSADRPPVRVAMTETINAYSGMPTRTADLPSLRDKLEDIRRANVDHHIQLIATAAQEGVQIIGLGELFTAPYFALQAHEPTPVDLWRGMAEDAASGPTITELRTVAKAQAMIVIAPIYEIDPRTGARFNTTLVIDENGHVIGKYRKNHIPHGTNDQGTFLETLFYGPGDGDLGNDPAYNVSRAPHYPVFQTSLGKIGVSTCYDRHFSGSTQTLAENGAELVFSPAVTFGQQSRRMWELEFPVDAARYRVFIAGSNRRGKEPPWNQEYFGASYFVGPSGRIDPRESPPNLVIADLDLGSLRGPCPSGWDLKRDIRPEIYGPPDHGGAES